VSAVRPLRMLPTWRGMLFRPGFGSGGDIGRIYCSHLAAVAADAVIHENYNEMFDAELPDCWDAAFRGALRRLNEHAWRVQLEHSPLPLEN